VGPKTNINNTIGTSSIKIFFLGFFLLNNKRSIKISKDGKKSKTFEFLPNETLLKIKFI
jgi:hypothetical protein